MRPHEIIHQCARLGITPKLMREVREVQEQKRYVPTTKHIALLSMGGRRGMLKALERYKAIIDHHTLAHVGNIPVHHNVRPIIATSSGEATMAPAGGDSAGSDGDGGDDGDGDGDGPRRLLSYVSSPYPALPSRKSPRASRRKSRPKPDPDVLMHTHALFALVFIFCVSLAVTLAFALLDFPGLALTCLGLTAGQGWALAGKLVSPK